MKENELKENYELSSSESDDSLNSLHTAFEYEIPDGFYLSFSKNGTPWILPNAQTNWNFIIEKVLYKILVNSMVMCMKDIRLCRKEDTCQRV